MTKYNRRGLTEKYFEDQQEIAKLQTAILSVIPPGTYYHIAILALSKMLERFVVGSLESELLGRWHPKEDER